MAKNAGKAAVRCTSIDARALAAMESHGKRLDKSSERRKVRNIDPLIYKGLDLSALFDAHMDGVTQNKGANKPTLHFVIRFPPDLLAGPAIGKFDGDKEKRQTEMLTQAVDFVNRTHGGDAVYAARVDRDEAGETIVDIFAAPKYEKRTKRTKADEVGVTWASATKFGRELTEKHQDEIRARHPEAKGGLHGPRMVGIALQSEFATYFREVNGVPLAPKTMKKTFLNDRIEIEAYKEIQSARDEIEIDRAVLKTDQGQLSEDQSQLHQDRSDLEEDRLSLEKREEAVEKKMNLIQSMEGIIIRAVSIIRDTLGLSVGANFAEDVIEISRKIGEIENIPAEDVRPEIDDRLGF